MLDKIVISPNFLPSDNEEPENTKKAEGTEVADSTSNVTQNAMKYAKPKLALITDLRNYQVEEVKATGTEGRRYKFFSYPDCRGVLFRCRMAKMGTEAYDHVVEDIQFNPNHACFGGELARFLDVMENRINPALYDNGKLTRTDYALEVPMSLDEVQRGICYAHRTKYQQFFTPKYDEQLMIGARPSNTLVVYDLQKSLVRKGHDGLCGPLSRIEMRHFEDGVSPKLKRTFTPSDIYSHVQRIAEGYYNPFSDVSLFHDFQFPHLTRPSASVFRMRTVADRKAVEEYETELQNRATISGIMRTTPYAKTQALVMAPRSGLRKTWGRMTQEEIALTPILRQRARAFLGNSSREPLREAA